MAVLVSALAGVLLGAVIVSAVWRRRSRLRVPSREVERAPFFRPEAMRAAQILDLLPTATVIVDPAGDILLSNPAATHFGVVARGQVTTTSLRQLVRSVRRRREPREVDMTLERPGLPRRTSAVRARAEPLSDGSVALIVDDLTETKRVEAVRRDFVANVGHEIKTPVGALSLLVEAALDARDDPVAVRRFLVRLQHEAVRLARLVQELLDLSRLQGADPLPEPQVVHVSEVLDEATDRSSAAAEAKNITVACGGDVDASVTGSASQLVTALGNLLDNAIAYSPEHTRVAVGVRRREDVVEISVSDQGIGIPEADLDRIFERFYRVDPARSRATGGTGLGLSIVKHIVNNHGGEVRVWSQLGSGSTFTVRLPAYDEGGGASLPDDGAEQGTAANLPVPAAGTPDGHEATVDDATGEAPVREEVST